MIDRFIDHFGVHEPSHWCFSCAWRLAVLLAVLVPVVLLLGMKDFVRTKALK